MTQAQSRCQRRWSANSVASSHLIKFAKLVFFWKDSILVKQELPLGERRKELQVSKSFRSIKRRRKNK